MNYDKNKTTRVGPQVGTIKPSIEGNSLEQPRIVDTVEMYDTPFFNEVRAAYNLLLHTKESCDLFESGKPDDSMIEEYIGFQLRTFAYLLDKHFERLWDMYVKLPDIEREKHQKLYQNTLFSLLYVSPYTQRVYDKPLGYPGDFQMMIYLYENDLLGDSVYGKLIHRYSVNIPTAIANRTRINFFNKKVSTLFKDISNPKIMSVACGPAKELFSLWQTQGSDVRGEYTLLDFEKLGLAYVQNQILEFEESNSVQVNSNIILSDIKALIKQHKSNLNVVPQDLVYAIGLADYFSDKALDKIIRTLLNYVKPGGALIIGNVATGDTHRAYTELLGEWFVNHRSEDDMKRIAAGLGSAYSFRIEFEPITKKNVFLTISYD